MFSIRIHPRQLEEAVNPALYEPGLVAWKERLFANKNGSRISAQAESKPGFAFPSDVFVEQGSGEPVVRIGDLSDTVLDTSSCVTLASNYKAPDNSRFAEEVCFVAMTGATVGKSGFKGIGRRVLLNQRVVALRPRDGADAGFLFASLLHGRVRQQIEAYASGAAQPNISDGQILQCIVPRSGPVAAHYVGDKIRQAEQLRDRARRAERTFIEVIRLLCPEVFGEPKALGRSSWVNASNLRRDLNPGAFNPERLRIRAEIKKAGGRELIEVASIEASVTDSFGLDDDYIGLDSVSSTTSQLSPVKVARAEVEGAARILCEGPMISKLRPYLNKVGYIPNELARAIGSTELLCVRPKSGVSGWFLYGGQLKLESGLEGVQRDYATVCYQGCQVFVEFSKGTCRKILFKGIST